MLVPKGTHLVALNVIPNQANPSFLSLGGELTMPATCLAADTCPKSVAAGLTLPYAGFTGNINQLLRPFPQYGNFNQEDNSFSPDRSGNSTYNAMQMQVNKRVSQGLTFMVSYTVSKNITDADSAGPGVSGFIGTNSFIGENSYNRKAEKAVSQLDTPQSLVASFFYELPFGHGKTYLNQTGAADRVVSGWYVSGVLSYHSGLPTEVYGNCQGTAGDVLFGGCNVTGAGARVNIVPGVPQTNKSGFNPTTTPFWNPAAFTPAANCATSVITCTFGDEPRSLSTARGFAGKNEDFTIGRKHACSARRRPLISRRRSLTCSTGTFSRHPVTFSVQACKHLSFQQEVQAVNKSLPAALVQSRRQVAQERFNLA